MVKTRDGVAPPLVDKVAASGVSSVSQYVADLLAIHVGLPASCVSSTNLRSLPTPPRAQSLRCAAIAS
jgi:hypothetical protein